MKPYCLVQCLLREFPWVVTLDNHCLGLVTISWLCKAQIAPCVLKCIQGTNFSILGLSTASGHLCTGWKLVHCGHRCSNRFYSCQNCIRQCYYFLKLVIHHHRSNQRVGVPDVHPCLLMVCISSLAVSMSFGDLKPSQDALSSSFALGIIDPPQNFRVTLRDLPFSFQSILPQDKT